jgi:DNA polymerase-3 subunit gamma/tau
MIALARKYRPKKFSDLVAQQHIANALRGAVASGRVGHGYLFAGPRGVGKTTAARVLAMALNCENKSAAEAPGEPCGACASCQRVWTGAANLDVVELDAASNRGVDDARELRERAMYAASAEDRSKVYIVDEAHMLTREAWNALLKILEEPPPRVVFVFATTEPQKIAQSAAPILSRLQRFDFRRIGPHAIAERLRSVAKAEGLDVEDEAIVLIAKSADGGMRDALSLLDQVIAFGGGAVTAERVREVLGLLPDDIYDEMLRLVAEHDARAVFALMDRVIEGGGDLHEFVAGAGDTLRAMLLSGLGGQPEGLSEGMQALVTRYRSVLQPGEVVRLLAVLAELEPQLRQSGSPRLMVELLLLRWALMDRTVELGQVLEALGVGAGSARPGGQAVARSESRTSNGPVLAQPPAGPLDRPTEPAARPPGRPAEAAVEKGALTTERLRSLWSGIIDRARATSPMLGSLLAGTEVEGVEGTVVTIRVSGGNAGQGEGVEHKRDAVARLLGEYVSETVRVRVAAPATATKSARLTPDEARAERLRALRAKDPALNAAVDALDLELLE